MWQKFKIYNRIITLFFMFNVIFYIINRDFLKYIVPEDIAGYMFWLSLGLYLGFQLCTYEFKRLWNKAKEEEKKHSS